MSKNSQLVWRITLFLFLFSLLTVGGLFANEHTIAYAGLPAFPGAEGYGTESVGGRYSALR